MEQYCHYDPHILSTKLNPLLLGNSPPVGCPLATFEVVAPCRTPCKKAPLPSDPLPTDIAAGETAGAGAGAGAGASPEAAGFDRKNTSVYNNHDFT